MGKLSYVPVSIADDIDERLARKLRQAAREAAPFTHAPVIHVSTPDRRARELQRLAGEDYPEGSPERVARRLLTLFEPRLELRSDVERDFDFFGALEDALRALHSLRRVSRALVEQLIEAAKRISQAMPPREREGPWLEALGERGRLLSLVLRGWRARLEAARCHDPEDALWLASQHMPRWAERGFAPALVIIEDVDRVTPARRAFFEALLAGCAEGIVVARQGFSFTDAPGAELRQLVESLGGRVAAADWPQRPMAPVVGAWLESRATQPPAALRLLRPVSRAAEVRDIARQIKRAHAAGTRLSRMAVAFPAENAYRDLISETFTAAGIPFDAPFETPLSQVAPVAALMELAHVARAGLERLPLIDALRSPFLPFGDATRLAAIERDTREAGITGGADINRDWLNPLDALAPEKRDAAARLWLQGVLEALAPLAAHSMPAADFMDHVQRVMIRSQARAVADADCRAGADPAAAWRREGLYRFEQLLSEMRREFEARGNPELSTAELMRALSEQADARTLRPPETGGARVRVLGLRELRGARFERLWLVGLTDRDLPLSGHDSMFLPASREAALSAALGADAARHLCAPVDVAAQADYLFAHALMSADQVCLSLPAGEGDTPFVPATPHARLLACLGVTEIDSVPAETENAPCSSDELARRLARDQSALEAGTKPAARLPLNAATLAAGVHGRIMELLRGDAASTPTEFEGRVGVLGDLERRYAVTGENRHRFSPSQIDAYAECPHRFWSRYVMGVQLPEEPTLDTPANAIGLLLHTTFERFALLLREQAGQPAVVADPRQRQAVNLLAVAGNEAAGRELGRALMARAFEAACAERPTRGPFWQGIKRLVRSGLPGHEDPVLGTGLLARFVDEELARNAQGYALRFTEFDFGKGSQPTPSRPDVLPPPIELPVDGGTILLQGSVDRVDEGPDGLQIVDYKTGGTRTTAEIRDGRAFQLPVYLAAIAHIAGAEPAGMAYLRVPTEEPLDRVDVTQARGKPAYDVGQLVRQWLPQRLARLSGAMRAGVFTHVPFTPTAAACKWCDFAATCAVRPDVAAERQMRLADMGADELPGVYLPDGGQP